MINLLPQKEKKLLGAARTNTLLIRYNIILLCGAAFLIIALVIVYVFLSSMQASAEQTIADNQRREQSYGEVKARAQQLQSEINGAKTIFDNEILYSKALVRYANLFPKGTAIDNIKLDNSSFSQPTTLSVKVTGEQATKNLIKSMENSPYVQNFQRTGISLNSGGGKYPYTVDVSFTLSKEIGK
jgi:hypothetical protein